MSEGKPPSRYRLAVGLEYEGTRERAPAVGIKGEHLTADTIVKIAKRFGVPVVARSDLARALSGLEIDQEITPDLFEAVAILLNELDKKE